MDKINIEKLKESKSTEDLLKFSIINIDKPSGPTSFQVSQFVKNSLSLNKTSHLGTLDPMVSGVLPVALGRACRLNEYLMHRNKAYVGIMRLHENISKEKLEEVIGKFTGKIKQLPPLRSRVKRAIREREVMYFKIIEIEGKDVLFETEVQAGTYIRKICDDMGKEIGGAHMLELRRTKAGLFSEEKSINLYNFEKSVQEYKSGADTNLRSILIPGEIVSSVLPVINVKKQFIEKCLRGSPIFEVFLENKENIKTLRENDKLCIFSDNIFIGCYSFRDKKNLIAVPEFVFN